MAIVYVGGQTSGRVGNTASQSNNYAMTGGLGETVPAAGDFVLVALAVGTQARTPPNQCNVSFPPTWANLAMINADGTTYDTFLNVSYKFMESPADSAFTTPQSGHIDDGQRWSVHVYRGVDPTTPFDVTPTSATGTGTARPNPAAITPVTVGAAIYIAGAGAAATAAALTQSTGFVAAQAGVIADVNDCGLNAAHQFGWTSGTVDPAAYSTGSNTAADSWAAYTLALRPASEGASVAVYGRQLPLSPIQ